MLGKVTSADSRMASLEYPINVYKIARKDGVKPNPAFEEKGLCTHSVGIGLSCGHQCAYCSSPALLRTQSAFTTIQQTSFRRGHAIVDPDSAERILNNLPENLAEDDVIQLSTIDDAWSPEAKKFELGRKVMQVLLENTPAQIRVLTKNADVSQGFDLFQEYGNRVIVGLSISIPPDREDYARAPGVRS